MNCSITIVRRLMFGLCGFLLIQFAHPGRVCGQGMDEARRFLLSESEMTGYRLERESQRGWIVGEGNSAPTLVQTWASDGPEGAREVETQICVFGSGSAAMVGTSYSSHTNAELFAWGSVDGSVVGDGSWFGANEYSSRVMFVRGNVGASVFVIRSTLPDQDHRQCSRAIAERLLTHIEQNLGSEVLSAEDSARRHQISPAKYSQATDGAVASEGLVGFSPLTKWDSKWVVSPESFALGIRQEWRNDQGTVIGIDICEFGSDSLASRAAEIRSGQVYAQLFDGDDLSSIDRLLEQWEAGPWSPLNSLSGVSVEGRVAVHIYQLDPDGIEVQLFSSLASEVAARLPF